MSLISNIHSQGTAIDSAISANAITISQRMGLGQISVTTPNVTYPNRHYLYTTAGTDNRSYNVAGMSDAEVYTTGDPNYPNTENVPLQMNSVIGGGSGTLKTSYGGPSGKQTYPVHYNGSLSRAPVAFSRGAIHSSLASGMKVQKMLTPVSFSYLGQRVNDRTATGGSTLLDALTNQAGPSQGVTVLRLTTPGAGYATAASLATSGGSGTGLTVDIIAVAGAITVVVVNAPGTGYTVGDVVTVVQLAVVP